MMGIGAMELIVLLMMGGGLGLPLGLPPLPADAGIENAAPEKCLFYASWAGTAAPDAKSTNHTEQLLAEQEVQEFISQVGTQFKGLIEQVTSRDEATKPLGEIGPALAKTLLTRPGAVYLEKIEILPGQAPDVSAGMMLNCGKQSAECQKWAAQIEAMIAQASGGPSPAKATTIAGAAMRQLTPSDGPVVTWGFKGEYFIVAIGKTAADELLGRMEKSKAPPAWLADTKKTAGIKRVSAIGYLNIAGIFGLAQPFINDPQAMAAIEALGVNNLKVLTSVSGLDEQGMVSRTLLSTTSEPSGLLELVSDKPLTTEDLKVIPRDVSMAVAGRLDLASVFRRVVELVRKVEPQAATMIEQHPADVAAQMGFDFQKDLLASLGDVWTVFNSTAEGASQWTGIVATVGVRDKAKLSEVHGKVLQFVKQVAGPEAPFEIRESKIRNLDVYNVVLKGPVPVSPAWCITENKLVIAASLQTLKSQLSRTAKSPSLAEVPAVAGQFKKGGAVLMYQDSKATLRTIYALVQQFGPLASGMAEQQGIKFDIPTLPSLEVLDPHIMPQVTVVRRLKTGVAIEQHQTIPLGGNSLVAAPVAVALLLPAVQGAREAARRSSSTNNMKQIALALHNFHEAHKSLPGPAILSKDGKPLLSWRVAVLPYVDANDLYQQFHLDEPWDSEHNKPLLAKMPAVFANPSSTVAAQGKTDYVFPTGDAAMFKNEKGPAFQDVTDGTSNTIMVLEVNDSSAVEWTKPDDLKVDPKAPLTGLKGARAGGFNVGFADGSVRFISETIDLDTLKALFTPAGAEQIEAGKF